MKTSLSRKWSRKRPRRSLVLVVLLAVAALGFWLGYKVATWPNAEGLTSRPPPTTAFMEEYRESQRRIGKPDRVDWRWVPYDRISSNLKRAVIVSEDASFFSHRGFDVQEIRSAVAEAWEEKEFPRGASTLTQQLAKNLWLTASRNPLRKLEETILTRQLESNLGKKRILEIYLNVAEFGTGIYGAEAAARRYFGKAAGDLDEDEAARLAACLPNPVAWNPEQKSRVAERRVAIIRRRMKRAQWLERLI